MMSKPVCVVTGVGPGNGASLSKAFAAAGYRVAMLARSEEHLREMEARIPGTRGYPADVSSPDDVRVTFSRIRADLGPVAVLVHNAGSGVFSSFLETTAEALEQSWRTNTLALLLCGQEAAADMLSAGGGSIVVIGATASLRGGANFAPFASAKAAQRSLAQSMARALGPRRIHVAYVVVDGVIDIPRTRRMLPDSSDDFFLHPDDIAETVLHVVRQKSSAWTFELDVRPFAEQW
jgi:NAD(P)-dependent dehydrogenase (short-subunit alcohol dehydrogenase family)